jgi:steroid delta-isomerase-like uncharacterized protein
MLPHLNKETLRRLYEAINRGDFPALDHIFAEDYVEHEPLFSWISPTCEGAKQYVRLLRQAFPDIHLEVLDMAADKDKVWTRVRLTGTQKEEFDGIPPTGKKVEVERMDIYRFGQNRIVEHWSVMEQMALFQQLGEYRSLVSADL